MRRWLRVPRALADDRARRTTDVVTLPLVVEARLAPGVRRVDLVVTVDNTARDHRLRLLFPTGAPTDACRAATTFGVATRSTAPRDDAGWVHRAPRTFAHQGWVETNGLGVVAAGLPEAEVGSDGTIAITLVRAVGWLARYDLRSRPIPAGPPMETPAAQCPGPLVARLSLVAGADSRTMRDAELGLRGVIGGADPRLADGASLLAVEPAAIVVTAVKAAEDGVGVVVRLLNPTDAPIDARLRLGFAVRTAGAVRLDETPVAEAVEIDADLVRVAVPARALRTVRLVPA